MQVIFDYTIISITPSLSPSLSLSLSFSFSLSHPPLLNHSSHLSPTHLLTSHSFTHLLSHYPSITHLFHTHSLLTHIFTVHSVTCSLKPLLTPHIHSFTHSTLLTHSSLTHSFTHSSFIHLSIHSLTPPCLPPSPSLIQSLIRSQSHSPFNQKQSIRRFKIYC